MTLFVEEVYVQTLLSYLRPFEGWIGYKSNVRFHNFLVNNFARLDQLWRRGKNTKKTIEKKTLKTTGEVENIVKFKSNKFEIELPTKLSAGILSTLCLWVDIQALNCISTLVFYSAGSISFLQSNLANMMICKTKTTFVLAHAQMHTDYACVNDYSRR